jgi:hypothetical protein
MVYRIIGYRSTSYEKGELPMNNTKFEYSIALILICTFLSACVNQPVAFQYTDDQIVRELPLSDFDEIEARHLFDVFIVQGDKFLVSVEAPESLEPYLEVVTKDKILKIGLKSEFEYNLENTSHRVNVTMPDLKGVDVTNLSDATIEGFFDLEDIKFKVSDLSTVSADIEADSAHVDISDNSNLTLTGVVHEVSGNIRDLSNLDVSQLIVQVVNVNSDQLSEIKE